MSKPAWLRKGDTIECAYAQPASGPGWANSPVLCVVRDENTSIRIEYLQPSEQDGYILTLYPVSAVVTGEMTSAVKAMIARTKRKGETK